MKVHVYSLCWNERRMLPYYLRHYGPVADRFFVCDDRSSDGSQDILRAQPKVEVGRLARDGDSMVLSARRFYNEAWKRSRGEADWVIVCNVDEHLYHPNLVDYLRRSRERGITAIPSVGYQMVSDTFPAVAGRLCDHLVRGMRWPSMDKMSIFDPDAIQEVGYTVGRHRAEPEGRVIYPDEVEVKLLHYKYLGFEYVSRRLAELGTGLGPLDHQRGWGRQYGWPAEKVRRRFEKIATRAEVVV